MQAQGAMWIYDHALDDWRFYIVTSLIDTLGRRTAYGILLDAIQHLDMGQGLTAADIHLGSPSDALFRLISQAVRVDGAGFVEVHDCPIDGVDFDGVIYRSVGEPPAGADAARIEKQFVRRAKSLSSQQGRKERTKAAAPL